MISKTGLARVRPFFGNRYKNVFKCDPRYARLTCISIDLYLLSYNLKYSPFLIRSSFRDLLTASDQIIVQKRQSEKSAQVLDECDCYYVD